MMTKLTIEIPDDLVAKIDKLVTAELPREHIASLMIGLGLSVAVDPKEESDFFYSSEEEGR